MLFKFQTISNSIGRKSLITPTLYHLFPKFFRESHGEITDWYLNIQRRLTFQQAFEINLLSEKRDKRAETRSHCTVLSSVSRTTPLVRLFYFSPQLGFAPLAGQKEPTELITDKTIIQIRFYLIERVI